MAVWLSVCNYTQSSDYVSVLLYVCLAHQAASLPYGCPLVHTAVCPLQRIATPTYRQANICNYGCNYVYPFACPHLQLSVSFYNQSSIYTIIRKAI